MSKIKSLSQDGTYDQVGVIERLNKSGSY
jgi:hypothetical protein